MGHELGLRVSQAAGEFAPRSFTWGGRAVRVLYVAGVRTRGMERLYRVRTAEGIYELGLDTHSGTWRMCHSPSWFSRTWAEMQQLPRYPLPNRRQRSLSPAKVEVQPASSTGEGGSRGDWLAVVRQ